MFYLEDKNKFGLITSFIYFIVVLVSRIVSFIMNGPHYYANYDLNGIAYVTFIVAPIIALLIVGALAKDFIYEKDKITLLVGLFLFIGFLLAPVFEVWVAFDVSRWMHLIGVIGCIWLMSIRLIKSPNIGKIVGFIGILYIIVYLIDFFGTHFENYLIYNLWKSMLAVIPGGVFFSYFLCYEKQA